MPKGSLEELNNEIRQVMRIHRALKRDAAFVYWFVQSYLTDSEEEALKSLTGTTGDKNIDAIFIDHKTQQVNVVQGKFHKSSKQREKRNDVLSFAELGSLPWEDEDRLRDFYSGLDPHVELKFKELIPLVSSRGYELKLFYVTTGKISDNLAKEAKSSLNKAIGRVKITLFDHTKVLVLLEDFLAAAPSVFPLTLRIATRGAIRHKGVVHRYDPQNDVESWVFSMSGKDVGKIYKKVGHRLFARNIRGVLGDTEVNKEIQFTIENDPESFWYYNNGITMVCNEAKLQQKEGQDVLLVEGAQIINGQQTTNMLGSFDPKNTSVLVKVIKIARKPDDDKTYDKLVNAMVRATNWQNRILSSDLASNDQIQIHLEREFRKKGYQYIRKRMKKSVAKARFGGQFRFQINKMELAKAIAGCILDPVKARTTKEGLFEDPLYEQIFQKRSISFYLPRYWLLKQVDSVARSDRTRAYAKWIVLHFAWNLLGKNLSQNNYEKRFRIACEMKDDALLQLHKALDYLFRAVFRFYRKTKGDEATDIPTFFKRSKLDKGFLTFWTSSENIYRERVDARVEKFIGQLDNMDLDE